MALKRAVLRSFPKVGLERSFLTSESVQGAALPLEGIDNIHGGDGLPLGVFGVGDSITDDIFQENFESQEISLFFLNPQ